MLGLTVLLVIISLPPSLSATLDLLVPDGTAAHGRTVTPDGPLDSQEGATGDDLLVADAPESLVAEFEWIEDGEPYREFLVQAAILKQTHLGVRGH
jgi:hypothetical protein